MDGTFIGTLIGFATVLIVIVGSIAGAAWRFGRIEEAVSGLQKDVATLQADVKRILERLPPVA